MRINGSRGVNILTKWLFLSSVFLLTGSTATSEADIAANADATPSPLGMSKKSSLQPKPSPPFVKSYSVKNPEGNVCLKAVLGAEYMVTVNKKFYYFNINPQTTHASGYCTNQTAVLSLESDEAFLEFNFVKESKEYYTQQLRAGLGPISECDKCKNQSFLGTVDHQKLFKTTTGLNFKCKSELVVKMSPNFRLKIMFAQFQPFDLAKGQFGKDFECWQDYIKRIIPIIIGAIAVGILLIATISYLVVREYRHRNYESL